MTLLEVKDLRTWFPVKVGLFRSKVYYVKAVDGVSFTIDRGETLAVVGESGCGKTTLGRTILRLIRPTSGRIIFDGVDITDLPEKKLKWFRRRAQIIFQDPYSSLSPVHPIRYILEEPLIVHGIGDKHERLERVCKVLEKVKLTPPEDFLGKYPHMLSGGQRQRVAIARALILEPEFIVADEPVSMLDASVRVEILMLLRELQEKENIAFLYITHDMATAKYFAHRVAVMYAGKIVELGPFLDVVKNPQHPYTCALMDAIPDPDPKNRFSERKVIPGEPPSLINPPPGCRFHPRCPYANDRCRKEEPPVVEIAPGHYVKCWLYVKK